MPTDIKAGGLVVDQQTGLATTIMGIMVTGLAYFCDPRQDFSDWYHATEPLPHRLVAEDTDGDIAWGFVGDRAVGIPYDNLAGGSFAIADTVTTGAADSAVVVANYEISATEGLLIVTIANPAHDFADNEAFDNGGGVSADVDTSGGAGGGPSVTSATYNACEIWSSREGGTQTWALEDTAFDWSDTPITYEVRGALYQVVCLTGLELGTTIANMTRLCRQHITDPHGWTYMPYSRIEPQGDGGGIGLGFPSASWGWRRLSQTQVNRILAFFNGVSDPVVDVYVWSYVDYGPTRTLERFSAKMWRPVDGQGKQMVGGSLRPMYDQVTVRLTHLIIAP